MKNKLTNLNDYMFEAIERLNDTSLSPEKQKQEIERCKTMANLAGKVIDNAALVFEVQKYTEGERKLIKTPLPAMLQTVPPLQALPGHKSA